MKKLKGKVAIVTGSGRGIGKAIAISMVKQGIEVCIAEIDKNLGQEAKSIMNGSGVRVENFHTDVSDENSVKDCCNFVRSQFSRVDILINNAGNTGLFPSKDITPKFWERVLEVNLISTF